MKSFQFTPHKSAVELNKFFLLQVLVFGHSPLIPYIRHFLAIESVMHEEVFLTALTHARGLMPLNKGISTFGNADCEGPTVREHKG